MGLAEELKSAQTGKTFTPDAVQAEQVDPETHFAIPGEEPVMELPTGGKPEAAQAAAQENAPAPKIRILGKEFSSTEEAMIYAEQIALDKLATENYEKGRKDAQPQAQPQEQEDPTLKEIEDILFEDPKKALARILEVADERAQKTLDKREEMALKRQEAMVAKESAVKDFYSKNQDLSKFTEVVDFVIDRNMDKWGHLTPEQAFKEVAKETRRMLGIAKEESLPSKELSSKHATVGSSTGTPGIPTQGKPIDSPVDFISQVKKHGKRA